MTESPEHPEGVTRRSVARGIAWATPAVMLSATAPKSSASADICSSAPQPPTPLEHPGPWTRDTPSFCPPKGYPFHNWQRRHCDRLSREEAEHREKEAAYQAYVAEHKTWKKNYGHCFPEVDPPGKECNVAAISGPRPGFVPVPVPVGPPGPRPDRPSGCPHWRRHGWGCTQWRNQIDAWERHEKAHAKYLLHQADYTEFAKEDAIWLAANPNCENQPYGPPKPPRPAIIAAPKRQGFNRGMTGTSDGDRFYFQVFPTVAPWFDLQITKDSDERMLLSKWDTDKSMGAVLPVWNKPTGKGTRIQVSVTERSALVHYNDHAITGGPIKGWNPPTLEVWDQHILQVEGHGPYWGDDYHIIGYESEERVQGTNWPRKTWRWNLTLKRDISSISDGDNPGNNDWSGVEFAIAFRRIGLLSPKPDYQIRVESEWGEVFAYVHS